MEASPALKELREEDLDVVSAGRPRHSRHFGLLSFLDRLFANLHLGSSHFGNPLSGENIVQTNTAVEIAVVIGGGSVTQVIDQTNVL
jgi:sporulation-control protein spo0M